MVEYNQLNSVKQGRSDHLNIVQHVSEDLLKTAEHVNNVHLKTLISSMQVLITSMWLSISRTSLNFAGI
jgi:hypothetical protein